MNRLLLALLAFLAGLIAPVAPAEARIRLGGDTEIGLVSGQRLGTRAAPAPQCCPEQVGATRPDRRDRAVPRPRTSRTRVFIPSVLLQTDRALE